MATAQPNWKRLMGQMLGGAVLGAATTGVVLAAWHGRGLDLSNISQLLAIVAGLIYALIGLLVAFGAIAPNAGAKLLNVEDADELREERLKLGPSAIICILIGILLLALAVGESPPQQAIVSPSASAMVAAACLAGILLISRAATNRTDEFARQMSFEATAAAMYVVMFAAAVWSMLALLGITIDIRPTGIVALLALLQLIAIFVVCGKRGVLMPRV